MSNENQELLARYKYVCEEYNDLVTKLSTMKPSYQKDNRARFAGSLCFAKLGIESQLRDLGLERYIRYG